MSDHCHDSACKTGAGNDPRYRKILWIALVLNAMMFVVEGVGSLGSGSASLMADAIDFFGDAVNYGVSLAVLSMGLLRRARAALLKSLCMAAFGIFVLGRVAWSLNTATIPEPLTMGLIGLMALVVNVGVAVMLYVWREGDANMRSVWLCSRNDAIANVAVMGAALGVFGTASAWPDLGVAAAMGLLALVSAVSVMRQAWEEIAQAKRDMSALDT